MTNGMSVAGIVNCLVDDDSWSQHKHCKLKMICTEFQIPNFQENINY